MKVPLYSVSTTTDVTSIMDAGWCGMFYSEIKELREK